MEIRPEKEVLRVDKLRKGWDVPAVWITTLVGVLISVVAAHLTYLSEKEKNSVQFNREAENQLSAFGRQIEVDLAVIQPIVAYFKSSSFVNRVQFQSFCKNIQYEGYSMKALSWIPRVPHSLRAQYENEAENDNVPEYHFTERQKGKFVTAGKREEYYPFYYIAPLSKNEVKPGFDLASDPILQAVLMQSRDSGKMTASAPIDLLPENNENNVSFLVVAPIYQGAVNNVAERREQLKGYISAVFDVQDIVSQALFQVDTGVFEIMLHLFDGKVRIYPSLEDHSIHEHFKMLKMAADFQVEKDINIAGRRWMCSASRPTDLFVARFGFVNAGH